MRGLLCGNGISALHNATLAKEARDQRSDVYMFKFNSRVLGILYI